jgi:hypothetical protein
MTRLFTLDAGQALDTIYARAGRARLAAVGWTTVEAAERARAELRTLRAEALAAEKAITNQLAVERREMRKAA